MDCNPLYQMWWVTPSGGSWGGWWARAWCELEIGSRISASVNVVVFCVILHYCVLMWLDWCKHRFLKKAVSFILTYCGLVTPYGIMDFDQLWSRSWFVACSVPSHYLNYCQWYRDHFVNAPSQWEMTLHCNVISHWLDAFTKWSLMVHWGTKLKRNIKILVFSFKQLHLKNSSKWQPFCSGLNVLILKHREPHGCVVSTVATDALVLKHQAISIHNAD